MLVAAGTRNPNKLRAIADAYRLLGLRAEVRPVDRPAELPPQPVGLEAVAEGAVARARHALSAVAGAEHGVGVEAGVASVAGRHLDVTVAAVVDRGGVVTLGVGPGFHVPTAFLKEVLEGRELGALAERALGRPAIGYREGLIGALTRGRVTRYELNLAAVAMALVPRLPYNAGLYP